MEPVQLERVAIWDVLVISQLVTSRKLPQCLFIMAACQAEDRGRRGKLEMDPYLTLESDILEVSLIITLVNWETFIYFIYTLILLKSVSVRKRQVTILAR